MVRFASLLVLLVAASTMAGVPAQTQEVLLGLATDSGAGTVTLTVMTSGCTSKSDFHFVVEKGVLTVFRHNRDACKAMPERLNLVFTLKELGLKADAAFTVTNKFAVSESTVR